MIQAIVVLVLIAFIVYEGNKIIKHEDKKHEELLRLHNEDRDRREAFLVTPKFCRNCDRQVHYNRNGNCAHCGCETVWAKESFNRVGHILHEKQRVRLVLLQNFEPEEASA